MVYKQYNQGDADTGKYHPSKSKGVIILNSEKRLEILAHYLAQHQIVTI